VDITLVRQNMERTAEVIKSRNGQGFDSRKMFVRVSWHDYAYNEHEKIFMQNFSESLGFKFTSYNTGLLPLEQAQSRMLQAMSDPNSPEHPGERDLRTKLGEAAALCQQRKHWRCINQDRMITIDSEGFLHNCCVKAHNANRRQSLFDTDLEDFNRYRQEKDVDCQTCQSHGHHVYAMQQYRLPLNVWTTTRKVAENVWRGFNLGGVFPSVSAWRSQLTYDRPQKKD
jgi:hypothetical protein